MKTHKAMGKCVSKIKIGDFATCPYVLIKPHSNYEAHNFFIFTLWKPLGRPFTLTPSQILTLTP